MSNWSQRNLRRVPRVTVHYLDSPSYTYKNVYVDCWVDWKETEMVLLGAKYGEVVKIVKLTEDTLAIEQTDGTGPSVWVNPKYVASVQVSIMTAKQRARTNQYAPEMKKRMRELVNKGSIPALIVCNWLHQIGVFK